MTMRRAAVMAVALAIATTVALACGPGTASPAPSIAAVPWTSLDVGDAQFDGAFDSPYGEVVSGVAFGDGFVLVGRSHETDDQARGAVWTSPDGETWARHADPDGTFDGTYLSFVATDGRRLVVLGWHSPWFDARRGDYVGWTSDDGGATWARHDDLESTELGPIDADGIVGSPVGGGFVAWGAPPADGHTRLLWSPDGLAWQRLAHEGADDNDITNVAPFGSGFVAIGGGHWDGQIPPREPARAWFSPDGRSWTAADLPGGERTLHGAYPTAGGVYAIGQSHAGGVAPSLTWHTVDGRRWRILGDEPSHSGFTASNGTLVARFAWQDDRSISISNDGLVWRSVAANLPAAEWDGGMVFGRNGILLLAALLPVEAGVQYVHSGVRYLRGIETAPTA